MKVMHIISRPPCRHGPAATMPGLLPPDGTVKYAVTIWIRPRIMFYTRWPIGGGMLEEIETLQQRAVMVEIEELIQSTPDYADIRDALRSLNFIPEQDDADVAIWVHPALRIFVLLQMNLGGGYAGYRVAAYDDLERREGESAVYNAR
jgi:hypothetical protein